MNEKRHYWLTILFKSIGGLGGGALIGGVLYLILSIGDHSSEALQLKDMGWKMLVFGIITYYIAYTACHYLAKIENQKS